MLLIIEAMGAHLQVAHTRAVGQHDGQRWRLIAPVTLHIKQLAHSAQVWGR
jgi:hypothetical protein